MSKINDANCFGFMSYFSLGQSLLSPKDIIKLADENNHKSVVITDEMSINALIPTTNAAKGKDIDVVCGTIINLYPSLEKSKDNKTKPVRIKIYPHNKEGLKQLYKLLTIANDEDHFYMAARNHWGDFQTIDTTYLSVVVGGCSNFYNNKEAIEYNRKRIKDYFAEENIYIEFNLTDTPYFNRLNQYTMDETVCPLPNEKILYNSPILYKEGDADGQVISLNIQGYGTINKEFSMKVPAYDNAYLLSEEVFYNAAKKASAPVLDIPQFNHYKDFIEKHKNVWSEEEISLPKLAKDVDQTLLDLAVEGFKDKLYRKINDYQPTAEQLREVYKPRLLYELQVLKELGFADYFLVVREVVKWAKETGIRVGIGRGSAAGSLVSYLLNITEIDPIRFNLLFERFINPSRNDLPDIDLDFMMTRREEVIEFTEKRFGKDKVARISNYGELKGSSTIRDTSRVYALTEDEMAVSKLVPKEHGVPVSLKEAAEKVGDIAKWAVENPVIWANALRVEGVLRNYGRHASGIIVSGRPLVETGVVERRSDTNVVNWEGTICESAGMVKLDILGLQTLDMIDNCLENIKSFYKHDLDLSYIPLDDKKTLDIFANGKTQGIFQMEGGTARKILRGMAKVNPLTFDDIVAANALNRPGPLEAGLVESYIKRKNGEEDIEYAHPKLENILKSTYGVMVYQEQIMQISVALCGFTLSEADNLRKILGKKLVEKLAEVKDKFIDGAFVTSAMPKHAAEKLWQEIESFAKYCFNLSHSASYSLVSYQAAYCKAHYPLAFYTASLTIADTQKMLPIIQDAKENGIDILPPDINYSTDQFNIHNSTTIYTPFDRIMNVADTASKAILMGRIAAGGQFSSVENFLENVNKTKVNKRVQENLKAVGAFCSVDPSELPSTDKSRRKVQYELLPGIIVDYVEIEREMLHDKATLKKLNELYKQFDEEIDDGFPVTRPFIGSKAKIMVIMASCSGKEVEKGQQGVGTSWDYLTYSLDNVGIGKSDIYVTSLLKKEKSGGIIDPKELTIYSDMLKREIDLIKPTLIITCGADITKVMVADIKKSVMDYVGRVFYDKNIDANILVGFTPAMIYFDNDKQELLDNIANIAAYIDRKI